MSWRNLLKSDAQEVVDNIGELRDILEDLDEVVRSFNSGEMIDSKELKSTLEDYATHSMKVQSAFSQMVRRIARS